MKVFTELKSEFPDNWAQDFEVLGVNPSAFESHHEFSGISGAESEVGRVIRNLFETSPHVKVKKVTVSFSPNFADVDFGGTITVSGTF